MAQNPPTGDIVTRTSHAMHSLGYACEQWLKVEALKARPSVNKRELRLEEVILRRAIAAVRSVAASKTAEATREVEEAAKKLRQLISNIQAAAVQNINSVESLKAQTAYIKFAESNFGMLGKEAAVKARAIAEKARN